MSWRAQISRSLQELRFVACNTSQHSQGLRKFFHNNYDELKMLNPRTPFVYREAEAMDPFVYVRYDWGEEEKVLVHNKNEKEILSIVKGLVEKGAGMPKSPESDVYVAAPIIDGLVGEDAYDDINLTWDGKIIRRNPSFDIPLEQAATIDPKA